MAKVKLETRELAGGVVAVDVAGIIERQDVPLLQATIGRLIQEGKSRLVLNCRALESISSDGIAVLLSHLMKIRGEGGDIKFVGLNDDARREVRILGLQSILKVVDDEKDALQDFEARRLPQQVEDDEHKLEVTLLDGPGKVCVARLSGFVDRHAIDALDRALKQSLDDDRPQIVVSCDGLNYISSSGMGVFIAYTVKARNRGGDIRFCHLRDAPRTTITMLGLHNHFRVFETESEAVASYAS